VLPLEQALAAAWPGDAWCDVTVLVAISGGADSVALLSAMVRSKASGPGRLVAAHFNHRLRGEGSDGDAQFVARYCESLGVPLELGSAEDPRVDLGNLAETSDASNPYAGLEESARGARYEFLTATAARLGARYVVTAHTADDQAETILQRILRGTGLPGLAGIPFARLLSEATTVVRPLLAVTREEVLAYLRALGQGFREDASNADQGFMRNRIRHELLPLLSERYHPAVKNSLLRLGQLAAEAQAAIMPLVRLLEDQVVVYEAQGFTANTDVLLSQPAYIVRELLIFAWRRQAWPEQDMGYAEWDWLAHLVKEGAAGQRCTMPGGIDVQKLDSSLRFRKT
jgi:tRNA(Ile)-lysidine synthase